MTKEELQNIIEENRFSSLTCRTGDEIGDLVQEIYHDGMMAGYELAISRLQMLNRMPFKSSEDYMERMPFKSSEDYMEIQGGRIKRILNAIYEQRENN